MPLPVYVRGENFRLFVSFTAADGITPVALSALSGVEATLEQPGGGAMLTFGYPSESAYAGTASNEMILEVSAGESLRLIPGRVTLRIRCGWPDSAYQRGGVQRDVFCAPVAEMASC